MKLTSWRERESPSTDSDERMAERSFVFGTVIYGLLGAIWGSMYLAMGLSGPALIPLGYVVLAAVVMIYYRATRHFAVARTTILLAWLVLPLLLQLTLGGFGPASAVVLWGAAAPIGSLFISPREFGWWTAGFVVAVGLAWLADSSLEPADRLTPDVIRGFFALNLLGVGVAVLFIVRDFLRRLRAAQKELEEEKARSDGLLLNLLPAPIAERLKGGEEPIADRLDDVTILFADIVGFTPMAEGRPADQIVDLLDRLVAEFDRLVETHRMEKIRTSGDGYMAVAGAPESSTDHVVRAADLALDMIETAKRHRDPSGEPIEVRIGIDCGPVIAGVIGLKKFTYDVWGDTVNTASRMESHGVPGKIQVTENVYQKLRSTFQFEERGTIDVKGKGVMPTFFLIGRQSAEKTVERLA